MKQVYATGRINQVAALGWAAAASCLGRHVPDLSLQGALSCSTAKERKGGGRVDFHPKVVPGAMFGCLDAGEAGIRGWPGDHIARVRSKDFLTSSIPCAGFHPVVPLGL